MLNARPLTLKIYIILEATMLNAYHFIIYISRSVYLVLKLRHDNFTKRSKTNRNN